MTTANTKPALKLTHEGALLLLRAGIDKATAMGVPQCIAIVDDGCNLLAFIRMDGARILSIDSAQKKALTAASFGRPTGLLGADIELKLGMATDGRITNLKGGLPIVVEGQVIGGIGVGSGTGEQDREVAAAALAAFSGAQSF
jgi:glc operon protein GlcG